MSDIDLLEHALAALWSAEQALRLTLPPGIGWSVVDDLARIQVAVGERLTAAKAEARGAKQAKGRR